ncbi:MAG: radical SAM protein [Candidatus Portnoybacteria bacterium]|nr:radical SAM protein [Candidatus Portnoybacteria bacterium]
MEFHHKVLKFTKKDDPRTWWREYPPKCIYRKREISAEKVKKHLKMVFDDKNQKIGVYIQIPFCWSRCYFCKFYSEIPQSQNEVDDYLNCMEKELYLYEIDFKKVPLDNLYIGGGNPTLLSKRQWEKLFEIIYKFFIFRKDAQILTEGTPETSTFEKLKLLKKLGVNRFTIGAQSFNEEVLKKANRPHNVKDIYRAIKNTRLAGIQYINLDILLGLVGETRDSYNRIIKAIFDLRPDCVSFMTLDLCRGVNPDYMQKAKGLPFSMHSLIKEFLYSIFILEITGTLYERAKGFRNVLTLKGKEDSVNRSLLNRSKINPVFGIGSVADSFLGFLQYSIPVHNREYVAAITNTELPRFVGTELNKDEYIRSYFVRSYVLWGKINKKDFQKKFNLKVEQIIDRKFKELKDNQEYIDTGEDLIFLPSSKVIQEINKYSRKNYGQQERAFLFCLKYFYSPKVINQYKEYF